MDHGAQGSRLPNGSVGLVNVAPELADFSVGVGDLIADVDALGMDALQIAPQAVDLLVNGLVDIGLCSSREQPSATNSQTPQRTCV